MKPTLRTTQDAPQADGWDCVLVDDDELVRLTWRMAAERAGVRLLTLPDAEALEQRIGQLPKTIPIYIDVRLRGGRSGEQLARRLHDAGFTTLYLQTGYDPSTVPAQSLHWLKGVIGKEPPWPAGR